MMRDLVFAVKPVLVIDAKATRHILHRHGVGRMKHMDVAHLWLRNEDKSNKLKDRRVKSEDNEIIRKHATSMGTLMLKRT